LASLAPFFRIVIRLLGRPAAQRGASDPDAISRLSTAQEKAGIAAGFLFRSAI